MHTATRARARSPSRPPSNPPNPARAPGRNLPSRTSQSSLPVERPLGPARAILFRIVRSGGSRRCNRAGAPRGLVRELFCSCRSFVLPCALRSEASPLLRRVLVPRVWRDAQEAPHAREAVRRTRRVDIPHGAGTPRALGRPAVCVWGVVRLSSLRARSPSPSFTCLRRGRRLLKRRAEFHNTSRIPRLLAEFHAISVLRDLAVTAI